MALGVQSAMVGEVRAWAGRVAGAEPISGWLLCDGSAYSSLSRSELSSLYSVIGNTYGGTTAANFQVPNFIGRSPWGGAASGPYIHTTRYGGAATHTLLATEMQTHGHSTTLSSFTEENHFFNTSTQSANHQHQSWAVSAPRVTGFNNPRYISVGSGGAQSGYVTTTNDAHTHVIQSISSAGAHTHTVTVGSIGSGTAHENMPPYVKTLFLIKY